MAECVRETHNKNIQKHMSYPNPTQVFGVVSQPYYPVPAVGMVSMMVPSTMATTPASSIGQVTVSTPAIISRPPTTVIRQQPPHLKDASDKPPVTTVFVGNITEKAPDVMIKQLLQRCGNVLSWKRVQGASGKLQAFGFCEYEDPEATLRCIRLLNDWKIGDKNLVVKVDPKTRELLDDYKRKKRDARSAETSHDSERDSSESPTKKPSAASGDGGGDGVDATEVEDVVDETTLRDDETVRLGLQAILREYAADIKKSMDAEDKADEAKRSADKRKDRLEGPRHLTIEDMDLDNDRKDLINREIETFRNRHKEEEDREEAREREREREARRRRTQESMTSSRRDHLTGSGASSYHHHHHSSSGNHRDSLVLTGDSSSLGGSSRITGHREESSGRSSRKRSRSRSREGGGSRSSRSNRHDEQEEAMRKKLERELRKKETAYQERLKQWEARERKKLKEYEREKEREHKTEHEGQAEARRLKEFFEDYDDDQLDPKYYKGSALQKRQKDRQLEEVADERDRAKEIEEIDETRRKLMASGDPDAETTIWQMEQRMQEHLCKRLHLDFDQLPVKAEEDAPLELMDEGRAMTLSEAAAMLANGGLLGGDSSQTAAPLVESAKPASRPVDAIQQRSRSSSSSRNSSSDGEDAGQYAFAPSAADDSCSSPPRNATTAPPFQQNSQSTDAPAVFVNQSGTAKDPTSSIRPSMVSSFREEDDPSKVKSEDNSETRPTATNATIPKSVPVAQPQAASATMDKKQIIKQIIDQIPTQKHELFAYPIDWTLVDRNFVNNRIRPWVDKKIMAYIGEEEPQLSNFICEKVLAHNSPDTILRDIAMVLDEEAEVFVVKMWRLLIYVIKEKNAGLDKT